MFKNCCGCKNTKANKNEEGVDKEAETYGPKQDAKIVDGADSNSKPVDAGNTAVDSKQSPVKASEPVNIPPLPNVTITEPDDAPLKSPEEERKVEETVTKQERKQNGEVQQKAETDGNEAADETVRDVRPEQEVSVAVPDEKPAAENCELLVKEEEVGRRSRLPSEDEVDNETLHAVARGLLATPHPAKRGSGIPNLASLPQWLSQEDDEIVGEGGGTAEPPATPVGRDELALRRHRFFSDLLQAHQAGTEHRVRFDPLGPTVAGGSEVDSEPRTPALELENLLNRLERVTTRLEQTVGVASESGIFRQTATPAQVPDSSPPPPPPPPPPLPPPQPPPELLAKGEEATDGMSVAGFNDIIQGPVAQYLQLSGKIGGDVAAHSKLVEKAFQAQAQFLTVASQSKAPSNQTDIVQLLQPTSAQIVAIQEFREKNRGSPLFNHLSAVSESIAALGWVTVTPAPAPYVKEMNDAGQFYTNRVLKDWKEKDKTHVDWVKSWVQTLTELQQFVKQHHTTGLVWSGQASAAVPPPPPGLPPPPPVLPVGDVAPSLDNSLDRSALFAEINKGEGITSTLKRVTPDMQTHKNTALRAGPAPFKAPVVSNTHKPVTAPKPIDKPPSLYKEGKKWIVEHHQGNHALVIDNVEMNNVVYMFNCRDSTLTVKGKLNSVFLDSCRKSSVVFDNLVSSVEFVNCQSVQMQVLGKVPTISIDKTDGCQMYLSPESLDVEIVSSKSSEMNVLVPKGNGDYTEFPIPEQFKTTVRPTGLVTVAVENKG
ncbi:adenylyl cyclase-associated protein 1 isoform X3 [Periplaneta americana]|uniref:adenylyl cyclase-associated protein 1 isoform X3 n=1 Tax=Periplaneta americana TaxID=6978 RepID=UPI0037E75267